ncbi:MAG TPA: hydroxymethylglutaryl-CoA synthase [Longimicrobiales bacterium]|nr:hydroxymethylglutaryl-CoA synthase [Longimicrobiales bacterium]
MSERVGIDDLNVDGGTLALDSAEIAAARGFSGRDLQAVGFERRSVVPPYEDAATLAVNAARPLLDAGGRDRFELLIVATESGVDYGKPLSAYVHRYLGLGSRCRNLEVKHACYAGTAAIQLAAAWVRSGDAPGKQALVVMTDVARRHFGDPAELTAGSGAVAAVIAEEPRVLEIEPRSGYACREVWDVARPTATSEWGDAVLSIAAYLDLLEEAWASYCCATRVTAALDERFRYFLYHTPLVSLVRDAHRLLFEGDRTDVSHSDAARSFDRMVAPALGHARELANIYSGSVYCLLAGLLDGEAELVAGTPVGIASYGSGSCAEIYGGLVAETARATVRRHRIRDHLAARARVDVAQYERLVREGEAVAVARDYEPDRDFVPGHFERSYTERERLVLVGIENHHRHYGWSTR